MLNILYKNIAKNFLEKNRLKLNKILKKIDFLHNNIFNIKKGIKKWKNGDIYDGEWVNDNREG